MSLTKIIRVNVFRKYFNEKMSEIIHTQINFPSEILPPYMIHFYPNTNINGILYKLSFDDQVKYTKILSYTKQFGEYIEDIEDIEIFNPYYKTKTVYTREYV
jgi:hypothetical protein